MKNYEFELNELAKNTIEMKCQGYDILCGLKEISGKLDTLIALKQVELGLQRQQPTQQCQTEQQ
jgi:hypothetical protein